MLMLVVAGAVGFLFGGFGGAAVAIVVAAVVMLLALAWVED